MSPEVRAAFGSILRAASPTGPVLEVGAWPGADGLLSLPEISGFEDRTALNPEAFDDNTSGIRWVRGSGHRMDLFADDHFGCVLSNSVLEHDPRFWETLAEIMRVTEPGGLVVLGVPGYRGGGPDSLAPAGSWVRRLMRGLARMPGHEFLRAGTLTLSEHFHPEDYYRFSEQAMREVLLAGLEAIELRWLMVPPRVIGWGRKPRRHE